LPPREAPRSLAQSRFAVGSSLQRAPGPLGAPGDPLRAPRDAAAGVGAVVGGRGPRGRLAAHARGVRGAAAHARLPVERRLPRAGQQDAHRRVGQPPQRQAADALDPWAAYPRPVLRARSVRLADGRGQPAQRFPAHDSSGRHRRRLVGAIWPERETVPARHRVVASDVEAGRRPLCRTLGVYPTPAKPIRSMSGCRSPMPCRPARFGSSPSLAGPITRRYRSATGGRWCSTADTCDMEPSPAQAERPGSAWIPLLDQRPAGSCSWSGLAGSRHRRGSGPTCGSVGRMNAAAIGGRRRLADMFRHCP